MTFASGVLQGVRRVAVHAITEGVRAAELERAHGAGTLAGPQVATRTLSSSENLLAPS